MTGGSWDEDNGFFGPLWGLYHQVHWGHWSEGQLRCWVLLLHVRRPLIAPSQQYPDPGEGTRGLGRMGHTKSQTSSCSNGSWHSTWLFIGCKELTFWLCLISSTVCSPIREKYIFPWGQFYLARKKKIPCKAHSVLGLRVRRARPAMLRFCLLSKLENLPPRRCGHNTG